MKKITSHFNFKSTPFGKGIETDKMLLTDKHKEVLYRLDFCASEQKFGIFTADCGAGKTTLVRKFVEGVDTTKYQVFYISDSSLTPASLYRHILVQLGRDGRYFKGDAKNELHKELDYLRNNLNKKIILIIDEAHLAIKKTIEEIRFLLNFQMDSFSPLALILVGQSELETKFSKEYFRAVKQRVEVVCRLNYLDQEQTAEYVKTHLRAVGGGDDIFTEAALEAIYDFTKGIPRLINSICTHSLLLVASRNHKQVDVDTVKYVYEYEML